MEKLKKDLQAVMRELKARGKNGYAPVRAGIRPHIQSYAVS